MGVKKQIYFIVICWSDISKEDLILGFHERSSIMAYFASFL